MSTTKKCSKCESQYPLSMFYKDKGNITGLSSNCKSCKKAYWSSSKSKEANRIRMRLVAAEHTPEQKTVKAQKHKIWRSDNLRHIKNYRLLNDYGITLEQYELMLTVQNKVCAACSNPPGKTRPLAVDHCHDTGKVRGLLCYKCNRDMSVVDDSNHMSRLLNYKKKAG